MIASCSKGEYASEIQGKVREQLKNDLRIGMSRAQVEAVIDAVRISGESFERQEYQREPPLATGRDAPERMLPEIKGYFVAVMKSVDRDDSIMYNIDIRVLSYFDESERLVDYRVERYFWH